jgi:acetoin utilization protein AcuB
MTQVSEVMTRSLIVARPDLRACEAEQLLEQHGIRHLLVLEGQELVGVLCVCDLRRAAPNASIASCMSRPVRTVPAWASIEEAGQTLRSLRYGCLPVMRDGLLLGMVTCRDLRKAGLSVTDLVANVCAACHEHHDLASGEDAVAFCAACRERAHPEEGEELGEAD